MSKKTTPTASTSAYPKSWRTIVLEALDLHRGHTLPLAAIYAAVEAHPEFNERSKHNKDPRARVRATCQRLRDQDELKWNAKGRWHVPSDLTV